MSEHITALNLVLNEVKYRFQDRFGCCDEIFTQDKTSSLSKCENF
ncbi:hypothetical protein [Campylobacter concisus]|nr:hypothetical protein [Campylobacter concisus]